METKKYFILSNIILWVFSAANASPLISVGNHANIFFNASYSAIWQSNILYEDNNEEEDLFFIFSPGLELNVSSGVSNFDLNLAMDYDIQRYNDLTEFDREYFNVRAISSYKTARWSLDGSASFAERYSTAGQENLIDGSADTDEGNDLILIDDIRANLKGKYQFSPKFSLESGVGYFDRDYTNNDQLANRETFTLPFDIFYELTPKLDLSFGYQFNTSEISRSVFPTDTGEIVFGAHNMEAHFFNLGTRGKLLPKLEGFFKIGYRRVVPEDSTRTIASVPSTPLQRDSQSILGLDADFTYPVTPKLTSYLRLNRGFDVGSEGQTTQNTSVDMSADYTISGNYTARSFFRYTLREFEDGPSTGDDTIYNIGIRFSYVPDKYLRFSAGYTYTENDSDRMSQGYVNNSLDLSASFRY